MKAILVFFAVFLFINLISIYIMGGFYNHTIISGYLTQLIACVVGAFVGIIYHSENKG